MCLSKRDILNRVRNDDVVEANKVLKNSVIYIPIKKRMSAQDWLFLSMVSLAVSMLINIYLLHGRRRFLPCLVIFVLFCIYVLSLRKDR
eukprot:UN01535